MGAGAVPDVKARSMKSRYLRALSGVVLMLAEANLAHAQSTINVGLPATSADLTSLVVRQQFQAAASDINGLLSKHAATSVGQCPATPYPGEDCLTIGSTPYTWNIWTGGTAGWATFATINPSTGMVTIGLNASDIASVAPISLTFSGGVATLGLNFNTSLTATDGILSINLANPNTYTATQSFPAGSIPNSELANSTISGVALGGNLGTLTFGTHLTGASYNGSGAITLGIDATNANTASTIVARDASGNFSAGTITASLTGGASLDLPLAGGTMSGNLAMGSHAISGISTINGVAIPASAILGLTDTQSPTNKSFTSSTDVLGGVTMTLGSDATGDLYCRNSSGLLSRIGIGASATLLTSGGAGTCPTWVAAPGGGNVSNSGAPSANQFALWVSPTGIEGVNAAAKSDQQAGTSAILPVTPSQQQSHDSAAKAWVTFTSTTGAILASSNVASVSRTSAGLYVVTFTTAFASANYACNVTNSSNSVFLLAQVNSKITTSATVQTGTPAGVGTDGVDVNVVCFGRQ
jgi:hypothetical protein